VLIFSLLSPLLGTPKKKSPIHEFKMARSFSDPPGADASASPYRYPESIYEKRLVAIEVAVFLSGSARLARMT
jgi:hypothetical protein